MTGKFFRRVLGGIKLFAGFLSRNFLKFTGNSGSFDVSRENWPSSLVDSSVFYIEIVKYYDCSLPQHLRKHRAYFSENQRGFGEDAFHVMWWMLFKEFRPTSFLEIGVYRGQILSLASLLQREFAIEGAVTGISPFLPIGDSVSKYREDVDYLQDTRKNFQYFLLPEPELLRAFSTDEVAIKRIQSQFWDAVYIDGNHNYETAREDWDHCSNCVNVGGIVILDDSGLETGYRSPLFASVGHPGPSRLANEIDRQRFKEVLQVGHNRVFQRIA